MAYKPKVLEVAAGGTGLSSSGIATNVLTSDGSAWNSSVPMILQPNKYVVISEDFIIGTGGTNFIIGNYPWSFPSAGWTNASAAQVSGRPGIITSASFSTNIYLALGAIISGGAHSIILGGGVITLSWYINIVNLSGGANTYNLRIGLGDTLGADQANGCYFEYTDTENSGQWVTKTAAASSRTAFNTSTTVATGWQVLTLNINAAGNSVDFLYNGTLLHTETNTIPTLPIQALFESDRSAGTIAAGTFLIDLFYFQQTLTTAR